MAGLPLADLGDVANVIIAALTVPLLVLNGFLACVAKRSADAAVATADTAKRQTSIAALSVEAAIIPLLVEVPADPGKEETIRLSSGILTTTRGAIPVRTTDAASQFSLPVRNVGSGPATITKTRVAISFRDDMIELPVEPSLSRAIVAPR